MSLEWKIRQHLQHFNEKKYFKWHFFVGNCNKKNRLLKLFYMYKIKKSDAFNNASLGARINSCVFANKPTLPHGTWGIVISPLSKIGKNITIFHQVTIGNKYFNNENDALISPTIEDNVVIFPGAKILGNITVHKNSIVLANCVVTKDVPANAIFGGVPGKVIKQLSNDEMNTLKKKRGRY